MLAMVLLVLGAIAVVVEMEIGSKSNIQRRRRDFMLLDPGLLLFIGGAFFGGSVVCFLYTHRCCITGKLTKTKKTQHAHKDNGKEK